MEKTIITVVGKDTVGIIAKVCTFLSQNNVNILDISQTIVQDFFNMIMVVDVSKGVLKHAELSDGLTNLGKEMGVVITCQKEEIFESMHRI